jgi:hypothetical protein
MSLFTALEDFLHRSLSAFPTVWEKLCFVSELRGDNQRYEHWGLQQKYGESEAQTALADAHAGLCNEVVSTQLAELWLAANQAAHREELEVEEFFKRLRSTDRLPGNLQGVTPEHFDFVVTNLSRVSRARSASSRLAA